MKDECVQAGYVRRTSSVELAAGSRRLTASICSRSHIALSLCLFANREMIARATITVRGSDRRKGHPQDRATSLRMKPAHLRKAGHGRSEFLARLRPRLRA